MPEKIQVDFLKKSVDGGVLYKGIDRVLCTVFVGFKKKKLYCLVTFVCFC